MKLDIDTPVRYPDGEQVGIIKKVVYDPQTATVSELVVETGELLGRQILVPVTMLREDPGEVLTLDATPAEVDQLPGYEVEQYVAAPEGWLPGLSFMPGDLLLPATIQYPVMPLVEESNAPAGSVELSQGTEVRCGDDRL